MGLQVTVDPEVCMGTGNCVLHAAGVFEQRDDGTSFVREPYADQEKRIEFAAQSCPSGAITVVRGENGADA